MDCCLKNSKTIKNKKRLKVMNKVYANVHREIMNHKAYEDVLDVLPPQLSDTDYMECYNFWCNEGIQRFSTKKKYIKGIGNVFPCKIHGKYPIWGSGFLACPEPNCKNESLDNSVKGRAIRSWNNNQSK